MAKDAGPGLGVLLVVAATGLAAYAFGRGMAVPAALRPGGRHDTQPGRLKHESGSSGAGRNANSPIQIPARGWWDVVKRVAAGFLDDRLMTEAAGMTFYSLLAIFPALATLVSLYGFFSDPASVNDQLTPLYRVIPSGGMELLSGQLKALTSGPKQALGFGVLAGLLISLWTSNQGIKGLFDALNVVYHEKEKRSFIRYTLVTLGFTFSGLVFTAFALSMVVVVPIVLAFFGLGDWATTLIAAARWPVLLVVLMLFLSLVYRYGPSRERAKWRWVTWGSVFATITWLIASIGFSYYVGNFGSYNKTYGSLGAVVGFMTWIWISSIIVLLGGELNAELEQQTFRDSTTGDPKPIGKRGAYKADVKL